jgi:hypothetical protein
MLFHGLDFQIAERLKVNYLTARFHIDGLFGSVGTTQPCNRIRGHSQPSAMQFRDQFRADRSAQCSPIRQVRLPQMAESGSCRFGQPALQ